HHLFIHFSYHLLLSCLFSFFFLILPPPPRSTLFPYTTLFRSSYVRFAQRRSDSHLGRDANESGGIQERLDDDSRDGAPHLPLSSGRAPLDRRGDRCLRRTTGASSRRTYEQGRGLGRDGARHASGPSRRW